MCIVLLSSRVFHSRTPLYFKSILGEAAERRRHVVRTQRAAHGPSFAYSRPVHSFHTRRDRVASSTPCRLHGATTQRAPPLGPGRALALPCGWNNAGHGAAKDRGHLQQRLPGPHRARAAGAAGAATGERLIDFKNWSFIELLRLLRCRQLRCSPVPGFRSLHCFSA